MSSTRRSAPSSVRSGIGRNSDEWEAPERLSSSSQKEKLQAQARDGEWSRPTPLRESRGGGGGGGDTSSVYALSSAGRAEMKSDLVSRSGYFSGSRGRQEGGEEEDVEEEIFTSGRRGERRGRGYGGDKSDEEDDFDRDFYLAEEGTVMTGGDGGGDDDSFLGSSSKFKQREAEMAKRRARGDTKVAGMSARSSQLHADQEAWENNRMLSSGVATERDVSA